AHVLLTVALLVAVGTVRHREAGPLVPLVKLPKHLAEEGDRPPYGLGRSDDGGLLLAPVEFGPRPPYLVVVVGDGRLPVAVFRVAVLLLERDGLERLLVYGDEPAHAAHLPTRVERPREDGDVPLERCPVVGEHV